MGNCGEKRRGIWRKEEVWIGPIEVYKHFAPRQTLNIMNSLKLGCVEPIVLLLKTSFDSQYSIYKTKQKDSDLIDILVEYLLPWDWIHFLSTPRVQIEQTLWAVITYHKRFISICEIIRITLLKAKKWIVLSITDKVMRIIWK